MHMSYVKHFLYRHVVATYDLRTGTSVVQVECTHRIVAATAEHHSAVRRKVHAQHRAIVFILGSAF